jgi:hypothetical protein
MKTVLMGIVTALALSWAEPVSAQQGPTGNTLLERGAAAQKRIDAGQARTADWQESAWLTGFVYGIVATLDMLDPKVCVPDGSSTGQWQRVLIQYLEANPADLHKSADELAIAAFRKAFPCRKP